MEKIIFVVDDSDINLTVAKEALKGQYRVMTLQSAKKMFSLMEKVTPALILMDIEMPEMNGFEALTRMKDHYKYADIPVIFLTGMTDASEEARGFQLGVIDFITKPFSAPVLINRIKTHLDIDELIRERTAQLNHKTIQLQNLQNAIISGFADLVENRDKTTGGHIERTTRYIELLINGMLKKNIYMEEICDYNIDLLISSARLHDVGKIIISDLILNKPAKLTAEEFEIMKTHTTEGERIIDQMASGTDDIEFLHNAKLFSGYHHERWDGKGYPRGVKGTEIPLQGRIMAIADVYDALISERPYKKPLPPDEAFKIIMEGAGTQFEASLVEVFYDIRENVKAINNPAPRLARESVQKVLNPRHE